MEQIITLLFLSLFPFGQIIRIGIIHPIDIVVCIGAIWAIFKKYKKPDWFPFFDNFLLLALFSWLFSLIYFWDIKILYGLLYLARLFVYFYFSLFIFYFVQKNKSKKLLTYSLIAISLISAIFGWIQYFSFPDIKPFFVYGWDEHLFRLVGTFLDPTFLGLILVFGALIALYNKKYLAFVFLAFSILFTYSRASYLALFAGLTYFSFVNKKLKYLAFIFLAFSILVFILPTQKNNVLKFTRAFSAIARVENYKSTLDVYMKSPIFGVGYNNLCFAKNKYVGIESYKSHACSGSDSSLLYVLVTTGILGFVIFLQFLFNIWTESTFLFRATLVATLIHSIFSNSLFYPWVLAYLLILFVISRRKVNGD
jgi:hypothetical protein